jgi:putative transposase
MKQKRLRLREFTYRGFYKYFVTIATERKKRLFTEEQRIKEIKFILRTSAEKELFSIWAYCFMPDHLHILLEGQSENSDMLKFIALFKQKSSYFFKRSFGERLWQENYYEHILRKDEKVETIVKYIFENPVRKRLVSNFIDYPYLGSFLFDVKEFSL